MNSINLIHFGLVIAIFIFIIRIYNLTDENPLENFDKNNNNNINTEPTINIDQILSDSIDVSLN